MKTRKVPLSKEIILAIAILLIGVSLYQFLPLSKEQLLLRNIESHFNKSDSALKVSDVIPEQWTKICYVQGNDSESSNLLDVAQAMFKNDQSIKIENVPSTIEYRGAFILIDHNEIKSSLLLNRTYLRIRGDGASIILDNKDELNGGSCAPREKAFLDYRRLNNSNSFYIYFEEKEFK